MLCACEFLFLLPLSFFFFDYYLIFAWYLLFVAGFRTNNLIIRNTKHIFYAGGRLPFFVFFAAMCNKKLVHN